MSTPTTPSTHPTLYAVVPNSIILYSCRLNHTILPVYLYSWVHQQIHNNNLVDTNLALITETFSPNNHTGLSIRIKEVLKLFASNTPDNLPTNTPGFSQCICYRHKMDNIKPTTRLQYYFLDRDATNTSGYTIITHDEYHTILDYVDEYNNPEYNNPECNNPSTPSSRPLNSIDLINLYCYLKMRINQFAGLSKSKGELFQMRESIDTISAALSLGNKTVSKYLPHLINMGLLTINNGVGIKRNKPNVYTLK